MLRGVQKKAAELRRTSDQLLAEYAIAKKAEITLTRIIRGSPCTEASDCHFRETGETECLTDYWHRISGPDGDVHRPKIAYEDMCDGCKAREKAYRDRLQARKRLGQAKRTLFIRGQVLAKSAATTEFPPKESVK